MALTDAGLTAARAALRERGLVTSDDLVRSRRAAQRGRLARGYRSVDRRFCRRVPGRGRTAVPSAAAADVAGFPGLRDRRPGPGDLRVPWRRRRLLPAVRSRDFGAAATVQLSRSYRSAPTIVRAAMQLIRPGTLVPGRELVPARTDIPDGPVVLHAVSDEREEAEAVAASIETMLGGASFHALDSRAVDGREQTEHQLSFGDFAVLYRTSAQAAAVGEALARRGFPNPAAVAQSGWPRPRASRRSWRRWAASARSTLTALTLMWSPPKRSWRCARCRRAGR